MLSFRMQIPEAESENYRNLLRRAILGQRLEDF